MSGRDKDNDASLFPRDCSGSELVCSVVPFVGDSLQTRVCANLFGNREPSHFRGRVCPCRTRAGGVSVQVAHGVEARSEARYSARY